jgi:hypothetical protein
MRGSLRKGVKGKVKGEGGSERKREKSDIRERREAKEKGCVGRKERYAWQCRHPQNGYRAIQFVQRRHGCQVGSLLFCSLSILAFSAVQKPWPKSKAKEHPRHYTESAKHNSSHTLTNGGRPCGPPVGPILPVYHHEVLLLRQRGRRLRVVLPSFSCPVLANTRAGRVKGGGNPSTAPLFNQATEHNSLQLLSFISLHFFSPAQWENCILTYRVREF